MPIHVTPIKMYSRKIPAVALAEIGSEAQSGGRDYENRERHRNRSIPLVGAWLRVSVCQFHRMRPQKRHPQLGFAVLEQST
jgi:hypothetical protein